MCVCEFAAKSDTLHTETSELNDGIRCSYYAPEAEKLNKFVSNGRRVPKVYYPIFCRIF